MSSYSLFFQQKNFSVYAIVNYQSFNDTLTKDVVSFEQLGPSVYPVIIPEQTSAFYAPAIRGKGK